MSDAGSEPLKSIVSRSLTPPAARSTVLVVAPEGQLTDILVSTLERRGIEVSRVETAESLRAYLECPELARPSLVYVDLRLPEAGGDDFLFLVRRSLPHAIVIALDAELTAERALHLLALGIPSLPAPHDAEALARLALQFSSSLRSTPPPESATSQTTGERARDFSDTIEAYVSARNLSAKQRTILRLYLAGSNDKMIAEECGCSVATVYEHWRRMAKKVGGTQKADVVADFHRFLDAGAPTSGPKAIARNSMTNPG
ncbi:MAG TPA: LuxR C-terminal-related transcriptional regulator [Polyangiaceae bacterium]